MHGPSTEQLSALPRSPASAPPDAASQSTQVAISQYSSPLSIPPERSSGCTAGPSLPVVRHGPGSTPPPTWSSRRGFPTAGLSSEIYTTPSPDAGCAQSSPKTSSYLGSAHPSPLLLLHCALSQTLREDTVKLSAKWSKLAKIKKYV